MIFRNEVAAGERCDPINDADAAAIKEYLKANYGG
jgi:hypothetical protein